MRMFRALAAGLIICGTLSFTTDAQTSVTAPAARPVLVIQSTPGGVQIYVDDELLGTTSPEGRLKISTLKPGKHTLRVVFGGNSYGEGQFSLVAGKALTKTVTLPEQTAAPGQLPTQGTGPSLEETFNWLREFLPSATGAKSTQKVDRTTYGASSSIAVVSGCNVVLTNRKSFLESNGQRIKIFGLDLSGQETYQFSFSEVDPLSVAVSLEPDYDPPVIEIWMSTRGKAATVVFVVTSDTPGGASSEKHLAYVNSPAFVDRASAERVAKAFSHVAELCAKDQPF